MGGNSDRMERPNSPAADIRLRAIGSFHVGGTLRRVQGLPEEVRRLALNGSSRTVDPNGTTVSGQMYVQSYQQAVKRRPFPVLLWHGGGMTGANWESTPDGRSGWLTSFLVAGYDVYVSDAVERGRASWSRWPEIYADAPLFRTLDEGWEMFRIGPPGGYSDDPSRRKAYDGSLFPVEAFDAFAAQWVPRWVGQEEAALHAYGLLLSQVGPCIVVGHSQGGGFALEAARRWPAQVASVVALEPSGAPSANPIGDDRAPNQTSPPHLVLWGDYIESHGVWRGYRASVTEYLTDVSASGIQVNQIDLPASGVTGNSHFPMLDRNSDDLATEVIRWLASTAVVDPPHREQANSTRNPQLATS